MSKGIRWLISLLILGVVFWLQRTILSDWGWLSNFNLILAGTLFLVLTSDSHAWLWTVVGGILMDSSSTMIFGTHLVILVLVVWVLKILLREVFSQLSWGGSLVLAAAGLTGYYLLILLTGSASVVVGLTDYAWAWDWILLRGFLRAVGWNFVLVASALSWYRWQLKEYLVYDQGSFWHSG